MGASSSVPAKPPPFQWDVEVSQPPVERRGEEVDDSMPTTTFTCIYGSADSSFLSGPAICPTGTDGGNTNLSGLRSTFSSGNSLDARAIAGIVVGGLILRALFALCFRTRQRQHAIVIAPESYLVVSDAKATQEFTHSDV
ncbi:hypothetical protein K438DRAFT_1829952 [Mycena galopus ATCC 62051]|nr:hypothetical protein K438DRAFT_1829952 [Mycena galopus ATCC 62051]